MEENRKLQVFNSSYFLVKVILKTMQNCLVFQSVFKYFKMPTNISRIIAKKPKGLSKESVKPCAT